MRDALNALTLSQLAGRNSAMVRENARNAGLVFHKTSAHCMKGFVGKAKGLNSSGATIQRWNCERTV